MQPGIEPMTSIYREACSTNYTTTVIVVISAVGVVLNKRFGNIIHSVIIVLEIITIIIITMIMIMIIRINNTGHILLL